MIFDRRARSCAGCKHWDREHPTCPNDYVEAKCMQPKDDRDHTLKRASDYCSKWNLEDAA
jgi:hypothetical protein